ncbi:unnamed protein product, partial [Ectocarpus sp. 13 AM-2016]
VKFIFSGHCHRNYEARAIDMRSVVTSSSGAPLGPDPPGFRVVRVFSRRIEHEYFDIDAPPQGIDLGGEP